ncbi:MAG: hypothetical protein JNK49_03950 [Planctomycetes bacterium]|nr:hypothetical protein [Planctomycetota bacterium]
MSRREAPRLLAGGLALALLTWFVVARFSITNDITHFLPGGEAGARAALARQIATGELLRTSIVLLTCRSGDEAAVVSREFEAALRQDPVAADGYLSIDGGPQPGFEEALYTLYQPRRFAFAAATPAAAAELGTAEGLAAAAAALRQQLTRPLSSLIGKVAPADPFLFLPKLFERAMGQSGGGLSLVDERFVGGDGKSAVLFLTSRASAVDASAQRPLQDAVQRAFAQVSLHHDGALALHQSGAHRHAIAAETEMKGDVQRVSVGSLLLVLVLALLFAPRRRSARPVAAFVQRAVAPLWLPLSWLPVLASGFLCGTAACLWWFGAVHGLTLAFGASLVGVSLDYAVHFFCHQAMAPDAKGPRATLRGLAPGLLLGATTTVVGFLVLLVSSFPGLRELALFAAVGLLAALCATFVFLPGLTGDLQPTGLALRLAALLHANQRPGLRRSTRWFGALGLLLLLATGLPQVHFDDSLAGLSRPDAALQAEDRAVLAQVASLEAERFVAAVGADAEAALQTNDAVATALAEATAAGELRGYRSPAWLLPSAARQRAVDAAFRSIPDLWPRLRTALAEAGFVAERFEPFGAALAEPAPPPITHAQLAASPLQSLLRPFHLPLADGRVAFLTFVDGIQDEAALRARVETTPGAYVVAVAQDLGAGLAAYRTRMALLMAAGVAVVLLLVALRYRNRAEIAQACLPALLAAASTVAVLGVCGVALTVLSLVALLMVVSMGVDYGIFLAEHQQERGAAAAATRVGVVTSGLTTVFGFGFLSLSRQPALFGIGITALLGITSALAFALYLPRCRASSQPPSG